MDHKALIARLAPETLADLTRRADGPGLRHLAGHLALAGGGAIWIATGAPLWWLALPLHGIVLCFLFTLEHEATHKTPFATAALNEGAGRLAGLILILPFEWFRWFHMAHHKHTNIPGKDPELAAGGHPETWPAWLLYVSGLRYWVGVIRALVCNALGRDPGAFVPPRARPRVRAEAQWMLAVYALALGSLVVTPLLFWIWLLPMILGQPVLRLYLLAEHGRCAFVADMLANTRTTYTTRAVRFLAWNMPYHCEHHSLPMVPFHRLPELHREMQAHLKETAPSYTAFTAAYVRELGRRGAVHP